MVDETIQPIPMKTQTRRKSRKVILPDALICSDTEDKLVRSSESVIVPVQLRYKQVDMPSIFDATQINSQVSPARSLQLARDRLADEDKSD